MPRKLLAFTLLIIAVAFVGYWGIGFHRSPEKGAARYEAADVGKAQVLELGASSSGEREIESRLGDSDRSVPDEGQSRSEVAQSDSYTGPGLAHSSVWKNPEVISVTHFETEDPKTTRIVTLLQPASVPYPVRVEEFRDERGDVISRSEMVADRFIVRLNSPEQKSLAQELVDRMGAEIQVISQMIDLYTINLPELTPDGVPNAVVEMSAYDELFAYAEPDDIVRLLATPDDPQYTNGALWGMHNTGQSGEIFNSFETEIVAGVVDADIDAPEGWDIRTDAPNVIVGVVDTGVRYTHEDIAANMWINSGEDGLDEFGNSKRTNGIDDDGNGWIDDVFGIDAVNNDGDPIDDNSHGTHVAGTVAAIGDNGKGAVGVAWQAQIMALKFLSGEGGGSIADAITCIDYAVQNGANLTNNSWGGGAPRQAIIDAIEAAAQVDQLFIAAAGNSSADLDVVTVYPASYELENIIVVAASDRRDDPAGFTNFGSGYVDIAAPGDSIISLSHENDTGTTFKNGTSMATPAVSGLAALLFEHFPSSDHIGIKNRILSSRRSVAALDNVVLTGGMINVHNALQTTSDAPFNDDFADALLIQDDPEVAITTNSHATSETNEPTHASLGSNSIWFKIEPANNARLSFSTEGSAFDTVMAVYTGASVDALTLVDSNDDTDGETYSNVLVDVTGGTDYYIAVAGKAGASGLVRFSLIGPPASDSLENAQEIESLPFFESADNSLATEEPNEPDHANAGGDRSIWYKLNLGAFGDSSKEVVLSTFGSAFDSVLSVYSSAVADPEFSDLTLLVENDDAPYGDTYSELDFFADANTTYWIAVDSKLNGGLGAVRLLGNPKIFNDDFEDAAGIFGDRTSTTFTATDFGRATREFGEPNHDNAGGTGSLWYKWSPDTDGDYRVETNAATAIGVYTGSSVSALTLVAGDLSDGSASLAIVEGATTSTEYFIAIDNRGGAGTSNDIVLAIKPFTEVENDGWENAELVSVTPTVEAPATIAVDNENASRETGEPGASVFASVWYEWVATETATYRVDAIGNANLDAELAVYSVTANPSSFSDFTLLGEDSDSGVWTDALVTFNAVAGTTYYFQVGTADAGQAGEFELRFAPFSTPANDDLANAEDVTDFFVQREVSYLGATREVNEPQHATDNASWKPVLASNSDPVTDPVEHTTAYRTLWYKWTPADASEARRTAASTFGSGANTIVAVYETTEASPAFADLTLAAQPNSAWSDIWTWGEVTWDAELGKTYYIMIGNQVSDSNDELYRVSITQNANDTSDSPTVLPSTANLTITDSNFAATYSADGTGLHLNQAGRSLWYTWTVPETGTYSVDTYGSKLETTLSNIGGDSTAQGEGGRFNVVLLQEVAPGVFVPLPPYFGFFVNDVDYNTLMAFSATAGQKLAFVVDSPSPDGVEMENGENAYSYRGILQLNISSGAPANDDIANATEISGSSHHELLDMRHASVESGETSHAGNSQRSVWWKWTAPDSDTYYVSTSGDVFDTQINGSQAIAVYTGPSNNPTVDGLTDVSSNKTSNPTFAPSHTSFSANQGQTYYIAVAAGSPVQGYSGYKLGMMLGKQAANNDFDNAEEIVGSIRTIEGNNLGATWQGADEPQLDAASEQDNRQLSVWWKWVAPASGLTTITTEKSLLYNELGVYTSSTPSTPTLASLDLVTSELPSEAFEDETTYEARVSVGTGAVSFGATAGETYYINVSGKADALDSSYGPISLELVGQPGVPFAPTNVESTRISATRVDLTWTDNAVDETNYVVERGSSDTGPWQEVFTSSDANVESWSDLAADADYYYRVRAEGRGGESDWVVVAPFEFTLGASETNPGEVTLTWPDTAIESSYRVSLRLSGASDWVVVETGLVADSVSQVLNTLLPESDYEFFVEALNGTSVVYSDTAVLTLNAGLVAGLTPIETWRRSYFGTAQEAGIASNDSSLLDDGLTNLTKFALGGNPDTSAAGLLPTTSVDDSGSEDYFEFTYRRREGSGTGTTESGFTVDGVTYTIEVLTDLSTDSWATGPSLMTEQSSNSNGDGTVNVRVRIDQSMQTVDRRFIRLRISEE